MHLRTLLLAGLLAACSGSNSETDTKETSQNEVEAAQPLPVEATPVDEVVTEVEVEELAVGSHGFSLGYPGVDMLDQGWSKAEAWGTWTLGSIASLNFKPELTDTDELHVYFMVFPPPNFPELKQSVSVTLDGEFVDTWTFTEADSNACIHREISLSLSKKSDPPYSLKFEISSPVSPESLGLGGDKREVGFGLMKIVEASASSPHLGNACQ